MTPNTRCDNPNPYRVDNLTIAQGEAVSFHPEAEKERHIAIYEFVEKNYFRLVEGSPGPYRLIIAMIGNRLILTVHLMDHSLQGAIHLSLTPLRSLLKNYATLCDRYYEAIRTAPRSRIEAIDMGRRSLHDEAANILIKRLHGKIDIDFKTARSLFTLIAILCHRP